MDEKELDELTKRLAAAGAKESTVTKPAGADAVDIAEYLRRAKHAKQLLAKANAGGNAGSASAIKDHLADLKRVARARAMQRELAKLEKRDRPFLTDFPELDPRALSPKLRQ